jgi:cytoskeletal protein CcmA (bactofilin family)
MEPKDKQEILNNLMKPRPIFGAAPKGHSVVPKGDGKQLIVGKDIRLSGDIDICESLVVEGELEANLKGSKYLDIVYGGRFKGNAEVEEAHISGEFAGELRVTGTLFVYGGAFVSGKISYAALVVEKGGILKGTISPIPQE